MKHFIKHLSLFDKIFFLLFVSLAILSGITGDWRGVIYTSLFAIGVLLLAAKDITIKHQSDLIERVLEVSEYAMKALGGGKLIRLRLSSLASRSLRKRRVISLMKNNVTKIRLTPEEAEAERIKNEPPQRELTPKEQEQMAFRNGSRKLRRKIAKRNGFFKDKSGTVWRESNRMIRNNETDVAL